MPEPLRFCFLVFPDVQQLDIAAPYEVVSVLDRPKRLHLVWHDLRPVRATSGLTFTPDTTFEACPPCDVLCVPGGKGVNRLLEDPVALAFVQRQAATARFVTSVCTGSLVLGAAGLLKGRRATSHWSARDFLPAFGAEPTASRVERDGNVFTAGGVTAGIDFGLAIIAELCGDAAAQACQLQLEYAPAPPFDAGTPESAPSAVVQSVRQAGSAIRQERERLVAAAAARIDALSSAG